MKPRQYNLRGISSKLVILQEVGTDWLVTIPAYVYPQYEHLVVPDFNEQAYVTAADKG
jgi:hypothetical protein